MLLRLSAEKVLTREIVKTVQTLHLTEKNRPHKARQHDGFEKKELHLQYIRQSRRFHCGPQILFIDVRLRRVIRQFRVSLYNLG